MQLDKPQNYSSGLVQLNQPVTPGTPGDTGHRTKELIFHDDTPVPSAVQEVEQANLIAAQYTVQAPPGGSPSNVPVNGAALGTFLGGLFDNEQNVEQGVINGAVVGATLGAEYGGIYGAAVGAIVGGAAELFQGHDHPDTAMRKEIKNQLKPLMGDSLEFIDAGGEVRSLHDYDYNVDFEKPGMQEAVMLAAGLGPLVAGNGGKFGRDMVGIFANAIHDSDPAQTLQNAVNLVNTMGLNPEALKVGLTQLYQSGRLPAADYVAGIQSFDLLAMAANAPRPSTPETVQ
jgi:hypothetical protein